MKTSTDISNLMVVSRDLGVLRSISTMAASNFLRLETAPNAWEAMERMRAGTSPHLLLLDLHEGDADCIDMLRWMRRVRPSLPVILIGHAGDAISQDESTRLGARAYLARPLDERQLVAVIESSLTAEDVAEVVVQGNGLPLSSRISDPLPIPPVPSDFGTKSLRALLKSVRTEAERNAIAMALEKTGGNRKAAARLLKVSYRTVLYKIEEYKMILPDSPHYTKTDGNGNLMRDVRDSSGSGQPAGNPSMQGRKELQ
jgi:DNA-binding NtrC family response regulator